MWDILTDLTSFLAIASETDDRGVGLRGRGKVDTTGLEMPFSGITSGGIAALLG